MKLSPLTLNGLNHYSDGAVQNPSKAPSRRTQEVEEVVVYRCPVCQEIHEDEDDAKSCCSDCDVDGEIPLKNCPVCNQPWTAFRDAADCCLWKDLDAPTRWQIADAVEAGSTWIDQLRLRKVMK
jgi:hypothetical protein